MRRQAEDTITAEVRNLLSRMTHGWTIEAQQKPFVGSQRTPDIMVKRFGLETIAVEAKPADVPIENGITQMRDIYIGSELTADWVGISETLQTGLVIRYPEELSTASGDELVGKLVNTAEIEYKLISISSGEEVEFPPAGVARGSLSDIVNALHVGASPSKQIKDAAQAMERGIKIAAKWIEDAIPNKPAIGKKLSSILGEKATAEACGKAALIITDAFIFQHALAGKEGFETVRPLNYYDDASVRHDAILADWAAVLRINYVPIFKDARRMVKEAFCYDEQMSLRVLRRLLDTAREIVKSHLPQIHELAGEIFQELIVDRAYVKANYTLPESAALLSALVCPDIDVDNLPKVADFACGTGALVNGVYKQVRWLYEQKTGKSSREIHRQMMENNLGGSDIYPHATHLTFMVMASAYPEVTLGATRVVPAPYGKYGEGVYKIGSLELLDDQMLFERMEVMSERVSGDTDEATAEIKREFPHGEMDIVIMNPPYLRENADGSSTSRKRAFDARGRSEEEREGMSESLKKRATEFSSDRLKYSYFVELAHRKLRDGGRMGFILPASVLVAAGFQKVREFWSTHYHNVVVVTIAQNSTRDSAFSADTDMTECIIVADKGIGENTGRAAFVSLNERPKSLLSGNKLARQILGIKSARRLEDAPYGGDVLDIGDERVAQSLSCPISAEEWGAARTRSMSLQQTAHRLKQGELHLPLQATSIQIPICKISEIAVLGYHNGLIKTANGGAFFSRDTRHISHEGNPAIGNVEAERQRAMLTQPNAELRMKSDKVEQALRILGRNSHTHYHKNLRFNANSQLAHWTEVPTIGTGSITNVKLENPRYDAAWTLWTNSTFGILGHWATAGRQHAGRGMITSKTLLNAPTLDVRELSDAQLEAADVILAGLKDARMLPYNQCAWDAWRHVLDARLLSEVLGITDEATHRAMHKLREMLCDEPTIAGTKKSACDLEGERAKFGLGGSAEGDAAALAAQQLKLGVLGIWLPGC